MKKFALKSLSFIIALTVVMSSTVFAFYAIFNIAKAQEQTDYNLTVRTEFYKEDTDGEWVLAEKVLPGENVKARVFIGTDYYAGHAELVFFADKNSLIDSYSLSTPLNAAVNPDYSFAYTSRLVKADSNNTQIKRLINNGCITQEFADSHYAYLVSVNIATTNHICQIYDETKWVTEFDFTVAQNLIGEASFLALPETVRTIDNVYGRIDVPVGNKDSSPSYSASMSSVEVDFALESGCVSTVSNITFNAAPGVFEDGRTAKEDVALIGSELSPVIDSVGAPCLEGYSFVGWKTEAGTVPEFVSFDDIEVFAEWSISNYSVTFDANGGAFADGTSLFEDNITYNSSLASVFTQIPVRGDYKFIGWQDENGNMVDLTSALMPANDLVLTALWETPEYTITYVVGSDSVTQTYRVDSVVTVPEFSGYSVNYWKNSSGATVTVPSKMPAENLVFHADFDYINTATGYDVTFSYGSDCFAEKTNINANDITSGCLNTGKIGSNDLNFRIKNEQGKFAVPAKFFDITAKNSAGVSLTPSAGEKITVRIRIPDGYQTRKDFVVLHWCADGSIETLSSKSAPAGVVRDGDYLVFDVAQLGYFGIYAVCDVEVINAPEKVNYKANLNLSGVQLKVYEEDGSVKYLTNTSSMKVSGFDSKKIGDQTVIIECDGYCAEFEINVSYAWWQWIIRILLLGFIWY